MERQGRFAKPAGRSSIEVLGPTAATTLTGGGGRVTREPLPRTGPLGALSALRVGVAGRVSVIKKRAAGAARLYLPAQAEPLDQRSIAVDVLLREVLQEPPAAADQQQQPATAVVVVLVHLEVLRQVRDSLGQQRDLDFRRAGVTLIGRMPSDDLLLHRGVERHVAPYQLQM